MATYSKLKDKINNREIQVESAVRDGSGKNLENNYAKQSGYYQTLEAGKADMATYLESTRTIDDADVSCPPIVFGTTGGEAEISTGMSKFQYLYGNSVKYNQQVINGNFENDSYITGGHSILSVSGNVCTVTPNEGALWPGLSMSCIRTINEGDKCLLVCQSKGTNYLSMNFRGINGVINSNMDVDDWVDTKFIWTAHNYEDIDIALFVSGATSAYQLRKVMVFNLTAMDIDATTADEAIAKLLTLGFDVNQYLPYNAGDILDAQTSDLESFGENAWDEEWEVGGITDGQDVTYDGIRSKGYTEVLSNTDYYFQCGVSDVYRVVFYYDGNKNYIGKKEMTLNESFKTPSNCSFIRFSLLNTYGSTYNNDISIYLEWDTPNRPYVKHKKQIVTLPNIPLRSVPNQAVPDNPIRDVAYQVGGGKRRVGHRVINSVSDGAIQTNCYRGMVTLTGARQFPGTSNEDLKAANGSILVNCDINTSVVYSETIIPTTLCVSRYYSNDIHLFICAPGCTTKEQLNTYLASHPIVINYELAEASYEDIPLSENPGWVELVYTDNHGTLRFNTDPAQNPQVPQPYFIEYTISPTEFLDSAYVRADGDANNLALQKDVDAIVDGNTEVGKATLATNIEAKGKVENNEPYAIRAVMSGVAEDCLVDDVVGVDVVRNRIDRVYTGDVTSGGITKTYNFTTKKLHYAGTCNNERSSISATAINSIAGHMYLRWTIVSGKNDFNYYFHDSTWVQSAFDASIPSSDTNRVVNISRIVTATATAEFSYTLDTSSAQTGEVDLDIEIFVSDLTQRYGSNEVVNAIIGNGTDEEKLARLLAFDPDILKDTDYDAGTLVNVKVAGRKAVNPNAWDGTYENGFLDSSTGAEIAGTGSDKRSLFIDVIGGATYYFGRDSSIVGINNGIYCFYDAGKNFISSAEHTRNTTFAVPFNAKYMRFAFVNVDHPERMQSVIVINLSNPTINGQYIAHDEQTYPMEPVDLHGVYKVVNGKVVADGDVYPYSGKGRKRYSEEFDFSNYTFVLNGNGYWECDSIPGGAKQSARTLCANGYIGYTVFTEFTSNANTNPSFFIGQTKMWVRNVSSAPTGNFIVELTEETDFEADPYPRSQKAYQGGTEEWLAPEGHVNPPVGHDTSYLPDLANKVETSPDSPTTDGTYVMQRANGKNKYTDLTTWLTDNDYNKMQVLLDTFGLKDALGGTLRQLLAVKESLDFLNTNVLDMGNSNWEVTNMAGTGKYGFRAPIASDMKDISDSSVTPKMLSTKYKTNSYGRVIYDNMVVSIYDGYIYVHNDSYTDATAFKAAMKGILLAYEKASS